LDAETLVSAPDARAYFLLCGQKKVAKEKATPGSAPLRGSLRYSAGRAACQNSPAAQTRQADFPRPACVAQRLSRGPEKRLGSTRECINSLLRSTTKKGQKPNHQTPQPGRISPPPDKGEAGRGFAFPGPLGGAEERRLRRKKGEHCLRGFSPELRSPRPCRVAQGTGAAGTDPGSPSSLLTFFLATQEESKTRVRRGTQR
jgi:hypothetical protein